MEWPDDNVIKGSLIHEIGHIAQDNVGVAKAIWTGIQPYPMRYYLLFIGTPILIKLLAMYATAFSLVTLMPDLEQSMRTDPVLALSTMGLILVVTLLVGIVCKYILPKLSRALGAPFITDYATTTPREDFADSYREYVLRRERFRAKAMKNAGLRRKYRAMQLIFGDAIDVDEFGPLINNPSSRSPSSPMPPFGQKLWRAA